MKLAPDGVAVLLDEFVVFVSETVLGTTLIEENGLALATIAFYNFFLFSLYCFGLIQIDIDHH